MGPQTVYGTIKNLKSDVYLFLWPAPTSLQQLRANTNKQPDRRGQTKFEYLASSGHRLPLFWICVFPGPIGNITLIPWTVSVWQGNTISQRVNRILVQEEGFYFVFRQVLCHSKTSITKLILHMICSRDSAYVLLHFPVLFGSPSTVTGRVILKMGLD